MERFAGIPLVVQEFCGFTEAASVKLVGRESGDDRHLMIQDDRIELKHGVITLDSNDISIFFLLSI